MILGRASGPVVVGHRGGCGPSWPPENTIASFEAARREGAHAVELDVRLCGTGEAVVFHDADLGRLSAGEDVRRVAEVPMGDLLTRSLLGTNERIPSLAEAIRWAEEASMPLNVEIKHDVPDRFRLVREVARLTRSARTPILVSSFDPVTLGAVCYHAPRLPRALLTHKAQRYAGLLHALARQGAVLALHVERTEVDAARVAGWKKRGLLVGVWTVNDPEEAKRLVAAGVDLLVTDAPGAIVAAVS